MAKFSNFDKELKLLELSKKIAEAPTFTLLIGQVQNTFKIFLFWLNPILRRRGCKQFCPLLDFLMINPFRKKIFISNQLDFESKFITVPNS